MNERVIILGGGVAGMSAAHELIERGFQVTVVDKMENVGGKARSIPVPNSGLPGEHGFRIFPGFYRNLPDTMKRIPLGNGRTVYDNLISTSGAAIAQFGKPLVVAPTGFPHNWEQWKETFILMFRDPFGLTHDEAVFYFERLWQVLTSCSPRCVDEYERMSWWEFIEADRFSPNYQRVFGAINRRLVAADPRHASARTIGRVTLQFLIDMVTIGERSVDAVLNGPSTAVWLQPWYDYMTSRGVDYRHRARVMEIHCDGVKVTGVTVSINGEMVPIVGDYYIAAMPIGEMSSLLNDDLLKADPTLANLKKLRSSIQWMNGMQLYFSVPVPIVGGHVLYLDSPWALASISQAQFWGSAVFSEPSKGAVQDCLSVCISDWNTAGLNGKTAKQCKLDEIFDEVWTQLDKSLNVGGHVQLDKQKLVSWRLDPEIYFNPQTGVVLNNHEPLLVNEPGTWALRPEAYTNVTNLFLASDYVRSNMDLATMEGANESARAAVNCILERTGSAAAPCALWTLPDVEVLAPIRWHDHTRYKQGLPWNGRLFG